MDVGVYALAPAMTRTPVEFLAKPRSAAPKPKGR